MGLSGCLAEWHLRASVRADKGISFTTWAWDRPESKYTTSDPQLRTKDYYLGEGGGGRTLMQWITAVFLLFHSVFFIFMCVFLFLVYMKFCPVLHYVLRHCLHSTFLVFHSCIFLV